jgi:spore coat protein U-like protein
MKSARALAASTSLAAALLAPAPAHAAGAVPVAKASIGVLHPLTLVLKGDLDFGTIARTGAGTVVIDPDTNIMTTTGGVVPLGGLPTAATFIGAAGSASVVIIRIPNGSIPITRVGGSETMLVSNFKLQGQNKRNLARQESFEFRVGATLNVGAAQVDGTYVGTFDVTVQYP